MAISFDNKFTKNIILLLSILAFIIGLGLLVRGGYKWYENDRYAKAMYTYQRDVESFESTPIYSEIEDELKKHAEEYKNTPLYPFFLIYQSRALQKLKKDDQALNVMGKAVDSLKGTPLYGLYAVKYAIMNLNADDKDLNNKGLSLLKELTKLNPDKFSYNPQLQALYFLGYYAYKDNNIDEAKEYWNILIQKDPDNRSGYRSLVNNYIEDFK